MLRQLNRNVFKCLLKVSSVTSLDRSATGKLFHVTGPPSVKNQSTTSQPTALNPLRVLLLNNFGVSFLHAFGIEAC